MTRGYNFLMNTIKNLTSPQKKNLARIIQECLERNVFPHEPAADAALSYTSGAMLSNMLQFYPQVEDEISGKDKIGLISKNLKAFRQDLEYGNVAIKILMTFDKEKERIPRLKGLVLDDQKLPREIQDLLKLRIEEALHVMKVEEKINQFRQRMEEYVPGLRREAQDLTQLFLCDNVAPRQTQEDDIIRLGEVTDEHLNVIEKYLDLREKSYLFRR
jgi:hypothetical protein